jgi:hypothetical protein
MFVLLALGIVGWSFSRFSQTLVHELRPGMTRDKIRAQLEGLSLRVGLMPRHVPEERATSGHERSIGALSLDHPLIRWVNITKEHTDPGGDADDFVEWFACFGVPDARLAERDLSGFSLHLASLRKIRLYGSPIGIRWKGHDRGLGVLDALENAIPEGSEEELPRPISVRAYPDLSCWTISVLALDNSSPHMEVKAPSRELWSLIERIASTLLAQELPDPRQQRGGTGAR